MLFPKIAFFGIFVHVTSKKSWRQTENWRQNWRKSFFFLMFKMQNKHQKMHTQQKNQVLYGVFSGVLDLENTVQIFILAQLSK